MGTGTPSHGTRRRYQAGCRCPACTSDNTIYQREYRRRTTPRGDPVQTPGGYRYHQLRIDD